MEEHWQWISEYLDGELTESHQQQLESWLLEDPAHQRQFAFQCFAVHGQLQDHFSESRLQESLLQFVRQMLGSPRDKYSAGELAPSDLSCFFLETESAPRDSTHRTTPANSRFHLSAGWKVFAALACSLLVVGLLHFWSKPEVVAHVARCVSCRWADGQNPIVGGSALVADQDLVLLEGTTKILFRSGAILNVEGPARVRLDGPLSAELQSGNVSAFVPAEAKGFALSSGPVTIVDHGTEFTVQAERPGVLDLYVHRGLVEAKMKRRPSDDANRLMIVEQRAIHLNAHSGEVSSLPFDESVWISVPDKL